MSRHPNAALSRRHLLKLGMAGSALLATGGGLAALSGCSGGQTAVGYQCLRAGDLPLLRALIPGVLQGVVPASAQAECVKTTLHSLDNVLLWVSPETLKAVRQLFDLLALGLLRGPLTGIWQGWESASPTAVQAFLARWQNSRLQTLQQGRLALVQLISQAWYISPESWAGCHYPGPPVV